MGTNTYKELIKHRWYDKEINDSKFYNRDEFYPKKRETDNQCISRHRLVRVKHAETFSTVYLLQVISIYHIKMCCVFFCFYAIWNKDWNMIYFFLIVYDSDYLVLILYSITEIFREKSG